MDQQFIAAGVSGDFVGTIKVELGTEPGEVRRLEVLPDDDFPQQLPVTP